MGFCFCATEEEEEETPQYLDDPRRHSQVAAGAESLRGLQRSCVRRRRAPPTTAAAVRRRRLLATASRSRHQPSSLPLLSHTKVEELVGQLSRIIPPVDVAWTDAVVNTSALPSAQQPGRPQSPLGAFERRHSMSLQGQGRPPLATPPPSGMPPSPFAGQQQQQAQQAPGGGAGASFSGPALQWTDSRKLLEAAIAMEQLQPIPESGSGGGGGWGGGWDGGALQVAEQRLQVRVCRAAAGCSAGLLPTAARQLPACNAALLSVAPAGPPVQAETGAQRAGGRRWVPPLRLHCRCVRVTAAAHTNWGRNEPSSTPRPLLLPQATASFAPSALASSVSQPV